MVTIQVEFIFRFLGFWGPMGMRYRGMGMMGMRGLGWGRGFGRMGFYG